MIHNPNGAITEPRKEVVYFGHAHNETHEKGQGQKIVASGLDRDILLGLVPSLTRNAFDIKYEATGRFYLKSLMKSE